MEGRWREGMGGGEKGREREEGELSEGKVKGEKGREGSGVGGEH